MVSLKLKIALCTILMGISFLGGGILRKTTDSFISSANTVSEAENIPNEYIARDLNGSIAIYRKGEATPFRTLDIMVDSLPDTDREMLKNGITLSSEDELIGLIEDYSS